MSEEDTFPWKVFIRVRVQDIVSVGQGPPFPNGVRPAGAIIELLKGGRHWDFETVTSSDQEVIEVVAGLKYQVDLDRRGDDDG